MNIQSSIEHTFKKMKKTILDKCIFTVWNMPEYDQVAIYILKFNNRNTRARCYICSKLTPCSTVSIVNFEHVIAGWVFFFNPYFLYPWFCSYTEKYWSDKTRILTHFTQRSFMGALRKTWKCFSVFPNYSPRNFKLFFSIKFILLP